MAGPFTAKQIKFVRKFSEALFDGFVDMQIGMDEIIANFEKQFTLIGGTALEDMRKNLSRLQDVLDFPLIGFSKKKVTARRKIIDDWLRFGRIDAAQDAARLRAVVYAAYYGHWETGDQYANQANKVHAQIGFMLPRFRDRTAAGELPITKVPGRDLKSADLLTAGQVPPIVDVVVVGSGSGGSIAALNFARQGLDVLVIEAGPYLSSDAITHEERAMGARLYKHGTLQMTKDSDIVIFQGRNVGGSPTVNNGICLRMHDDRLTNTTASNPFDAWRVVGADIGYAELQAAYDHVEQYLEIGEAEHRSGRGNGNHLLDGWQKFAVGKADPWIAGAKPGWFSKNFGPPNTAAACAYCGYCNTGCPYARRVGPGTRILLDACNAGARILPESKVAAIRWGPTPRGAPRRAIGVRVLVGPGGIPRDIDARRGVVVAAGTIASTKLLEASGIENDRLGKGISLNVASPVVALMPATSPVTGQPIRPAWDEDQMTTAVDCGGFLLESHFQPPQSMAMLLGGWYEEMDRRMKQYRRMRSAGVLIPIDRKGKLGKEKVELEFSDSDRALLRRALGTLTRIHFAAGALEVWPSLRVGLPIKPTDDIDAFYRKYIKEKDDVTLSSAHPHGGNAINADPRKGVVDLRCKVHGTDNVLVADASVFPACIRVNAQFTVMAVAHLATRADPVTGASPL
ncbi:MAG: GMC family oxidoreductase [Novosphingobium sp.]|nr:GMC family oxidoreductase [Novosphingobium sp.]